MKHYDEPSRRDRRWHGPLCALVCLFGLVTGARGQALPAWTTTLGAAPQVVSNGAAQSIVYSGGSSLPVVGRTTAVAANDMLQVVERIPISTPSGPAIVNSTRSVAGPMMRRAVGGLLGPIGLGLTLADILGDYLRDQGLTPSPSSPTGWAGNGPVSPVPALVNKYCWGSCYSGFDEVAAAQHGAVGQAGWSCAQGGDPPERNCVYVWAPGDYAKETTPPYTTYAKKAYYYLHTFPRDVCPDWSVIPPTGCIGPGAPLDADDIGDLLAGAPNPPPAVLDEAVNAAIAAGALAAPASDPVVDGPAYVDSAPRPVYTSNAAGASSVASEVLRTPISYANNTATLGEPVKTTVTNTTAPDGSTSTKTETATLQKPDVCKAFPWMFICSEIGEPDKASVPTSGKVIEFQAEDIGLPSGCPADIPVGSLGSISTSAACQAANDMRPLVIAAAAVAALMICIAAVRGTS